MTASTPHWEHALDVSRERRMARAALKERVRGGEVPLATVVAISPEILIVPRGRPVTVLELLTWPRYAHRSSAEKLLKGLGIAPSAQLHQLSTYRRKALVRELSV